MQLRKNIICLLLKILTYFMNLFSMHYSIKKVLNLSIFCIIIVSLLVYFWKWIDPALVDFKQQPVFLFDLMFLKEYLVLPGGLAEYLSLFISQFFHFTIPGAIIYILVIFLIILLTRKLLSIFFPTDYVLSCSFSLYSF